jgi:hypothetical protein
MKIKAILFGATGMVGAGVLHVILAHPDVAAVLVIGRRSCGVTHPKLTELLHNDFFNFATVEEQLRGFNACFFCLGVSSVGMSEKAYARISYDLTMSAANVLSRLNRDMSFCYVSGAGTDSTEQGRVMWARVKGRTENELMKLPFKAVYLFRPGFIKPINGVGHTHAISAVVGMLYPVWKFLVPQYVCTLEEVGLAMVHAAGHGYPHPVLENKDIVRLAKGTSQ